MDLGKKIYKLRKACNLSQAKLAYKIGIYPDRISNYETDLYVPTLRNLINITQSCNVSIKDFLNENFENCKNNNNFSYIVKEDNFRKMIFGIQILKYRKLNKLTQKQLAKKVGVNITTISRYENGYTIPNIYIILKLCQELNIDIDKMLNPYIRGITLKEVRKLLLQKKEKEI